jgi:hypothetical protein
LWLGIIKMNCWVQESFFNKYKTKAFLSLFGQKNFV